MTQQERLIKSFQNVLVRWLQQIIIESVAACHDFHAGFKAALEAVLLEDLGMEYFRRGRPLL